MANDSGWGAGILRRALMCIALLLTCSTAWCDLVVVTRVDTAIESVTDEELANLWLGRVMRVQNVPVSVIDAQEGAPIRALFYEGVIGMTERQLKAHWARRVFRGQGFPPATGTQEEILFWLAEEPNRIGYLDKLDSTTGLKILLRRE